MPFQKGNKIGHRFKVGDRSWAKGKHPEYLQGKNHPNWKGGITIISCRYVGIKMKQHPFCDVRGYVSEHRLVMEKKLGRYLKPTEVVHHINEDMLDNRIENLQLFNSKAEHMKYHHIKRSKKV